jgi:hypothetical protein
VIGGGSAADSSGFFPAGGAPAGTTSGLIGIRLAETHGVDRTKIWSGGGDISIASKTSTANMIFGQYWYGGTNVNSGLGQIRITNFAGSSTSNQNFIVGENLTSLMTKCPKANFDELCLF